MATRGAKPRRGEHAKPSTAAPVVAQVVPHASTFIRGPALELARVLPRLELHVRHNPLAELSTVLPSVPAVRQARRYRWRHAGAHAAWPANVHVRRLSLPYLRKDGSNPRLGVRMGRALEHRLRRSGAGRQGSRGPGLLHGHFLHPQGVAAVEAGRRLGIPTVVTGHGFDVYDLPDRSEVWRSLVTGVLDAADAVTTVSERNADFLRRLGVPARKLTVIPNGFDPTRFVPEDPAKARRSLAEALRRTGAAPLPGQARLLLAVGNLVPVKGHRDLLEAIGPLLREAPDTALAIVGSGMEEPGLRRQAVEAGIDPQVLFAGQRPHDEIPLWMNAADLFVLPSHAEGCGTVVQESLGCGLPVVATDVGIVPQAVGPQDGVVVAPRSPELLGQAIRAGLERRFDRRSIAGRARKYSWAANAAATLEVYRRLSPGLPSLGPRSG